MRVGDWKREVIEAVDEVLKLPNLSGTSDWRRLGKATPLPEEPGWYAFDLRIGNRRPPSADSFNQLCFAEKEGPERGLSIPVERSRIADGILRVQVTGGLPDGCDFLWTLRLSPHYLWRKLRDGIAGLGQVPLADRLAAGRFDPLPARPSDSGPPGFLPAQHRAYRACVEPGLHAVWGPPGTGKTSVLARAIEDLVRSGKRVLLVSTANVAVDNALKEVIRNLPPQPGKVIRVGTPHLAELANNDDVLLDRLAARATAEADAQRLELQNRIELIDQTADRLRELDEQLAGYEPDLVDAAQRRIENSQQIQNCRAEQAGAVAELENADVTLNKVNAAAQTARAELDRLGPQRAALENARQGAAHLDQLDREFVAYRTRVEHLDFTKRAQSEGWLARRRAARELAEARARLEHLERHTAAQHATLEPLIARSRADAHPVTEQYLSGVERRVEIENARLAEAHRVATAADQRVRSIRRRCAELESVGTASADDHELVGRACRLDLPGQYEQREALRRKHHEHGRSRPKLVEDLRVLNVRLARLRMDAEGEIVANARVVATTLARSRAHPAVASQKFDVVLVDEAGAAVLGEVLLAVSNATRTATLLGDFLQLGPVTGDTDRVNHPSVQAWLVPDAFTHCKILSADDALSNPGCVALTHQFRFGPNLRELANDVVYRVLADGHTAVTGRPQGDTDIILVDVQGLDELGHVHRSGTYVGWWPVGALLSRVLVEHHAVDGGGVGVVTPFRPQAEATLAALRDTGQNLGVAVGTAHTFQGREFDTVVFDLVEDGRGWISAANWDGNEFARSGVRLFGVGITRARKRLYLIANGSQAVKVARPGAPLGAVRALGLESKIQWCRASVLLGMADPVRYEPVSDVESELNEVLRGLVDISEVHDEVSFDDALHAHLTSAENSLWLWSPWVGKKSSRFLPLIEDAVARGVRVRVFIRTERDPIMSREDHQKWVERLKATGAKVIRAEVEHRKIVVVDRNVVLLGSHNPLSQYRSREVMITCRGAAFVERLLEELQAEMHGNPPVCDSCGGDFELWRSTSKRRGAPYFWRCHPCGTDRPVADP